MQSTNLQLFNKAQETASFQMRPIWKIDRHFKCPVIGTCLSLQEVKRILKKTGTSIKHLNAYEIHRTVMENMGNENKVSRKVDVYLKHKFGKELSEFASLDRSEFEAAWRLYFEKGEISALLWIAASRSDLSASFLQQVFGDIHMVSHKNVNDACTQKEQLARQQDANRQLAEKIDKVRSLARKFKKERDALKSDLNDLRWAYETLKREKEQIQQKLSSSEEKTLVCDLRSENSTLEAMVKAHEQEIAGYTHKTELLEHEITKLVSRLERERALNGELKNEVGKMLDQMASLNQCDEQCPAFDLCAKRILIVGGITKLEAYYRELIEERGGVFEYHDGYMNGGKHSLEGRVKRSDVVLCPVNCNSHNACLSVKKLCQKHKKPVQMLAGASLSAISQALIEIIGTN